MEKSRKPLKHSTQCQSISSNDLTARNKKYALWKNSKISLNREMRRKNVNISEQSTSPQTSQQNDSNLQMQSKLNKSTTDRVEKSDTVSMISTNNTEREIAETLYLLKKEISEWKARDSSTSRLEDSEKLIISSDEERDKKKFDEINNQPESMKMIE